ncbi:MAG: hypothetical protein FJZ86_05930 [Chloroflexi bacterium]|nr:hypothetical protein [Chloroflexota bacterium]
MAKVSLRNYLREIESLIEKRHTDEAIVHCRHILQTFPKQLETYRLLGKAYLESRRYNEAVDIFGRVLMCVPDDFVAHVGLSIIRDEENKLDDAIWHMERASESQPSNAAIQGELQRLYGRRDGSKPPKIRMTRGALAHMYVQGELYPQAIAEIRAVLVKDPQRTDMQILLATSFFKSGQNLAASDLCNQLLTEFPYCFDANRIMVDLSSAIGDDSENTQVYRMRVSELDPYAAFAKNSVFQISEVPDESVNLDRLEVSGDEFSTGQEWSFPSGHGSDFSPVPALGEPPLDNQPDWLKSAIFAGEMSYASPPPAEVSSAYEPFSAEAKDDIPDFLRDAGWAESNAPEQPSSNIGRDSSEKLVPADIPDWLRGQAPVSADLDPISETRSDAVEPVQSVQSVQPVQPVQTPKWATGELQRPRLANLSDTSQARSTSDASDWRGGANRAMASDASSEPVKIPDWSVNIENTQAGSKEDIPEWLRDLETNKEYTPSNDIHDALANEQDDAVAWLESLSAKQGAKPEELVTDPGKGHEKPKEWMIQAQNMGQQTSADQEIAQSLGASTQEQDDAVAWLESLAVKHEAKPEELVTDPGKRSEIPPEWVPQTQSLGETQPVPSQETIKSNWVAEAQNIDEGFFAEFEKASTPTPAIDETGMWLRNLEEKERQEEQPEEQKIERRDKPEWLSETQQTIYAGDPSVLSDEQFSFADNNLYTQDLSNWLSSLDDEPGLDFNPELIRASERPPFPSTPEKQFGTQLTVSDLSGTLDGMDAGDESLKEPIASTPTKEPVPVNMKADLPDWLQNEDETVVAPQEANYDDTTPWSIREHWEAEETPQEPRPTSPSDWQPLEEITFEEPKPSQAVQALKPKTRQPSSQSRGIPTMKFSFSPEPIEPIGASTARKRSRPTPSQPKAEGQDNVDALNQAKGKLDQGDIPAALDHYRKLIRKGKHLEETIRDLNESIYRYPVEVSIWQTLGDAYMRANRLMEALESYNKAEELIR